MQTVLVAVAMLTLVVAGSVAAAAAAPKTRAAPGLSAPLGVCAFIGPFGDACLFEAPYRPGGPTINGRFSSRGFFTSVRQEALAREFDESFTDRRRLMERCLAQKPFLGRLHRHEVAWLWKQQLQEYPLPADPNAEIPLSSSQRSLANYQYCMLHR